MNAKECGSTCQESGHTLSTLKQKDFLGAAWLSDQLVRMPVLNLRFGSTW